MQVVDPNYQLLNFSVSGEEAELRILIPDAKRGYAGTYTCQAMRKDNTHTMQSCRFLLDRVTVDVLNSSSALVMMNDTTGDDNLMQAITVRREEMDQAPRKIDLSPPYYSYIVSALDENTQHELTVYMGQDRIPVDRSVCIPAVRNLTGQFVKQENRSVFLNWEPTTCSRGPLPFVYQVCYTELNTQELSSGHCLNKEQPQVWIPGLDANIRYTFGVRPITDSHTPGRFVRLEIGQAEKNDTQVRVPSATIIILLAVIILAALAALLVCLLWRRKKRLEKSKTSEVVMTATMSNTDDEKTGSVTSTPLLMETRRSDGKAMLAEGATVQS
ncbi:uncharacterized protein [Littorina saxatilis]|uniref:uncharacterized protein n=1 Tax=Littorina saxatilis TaxID=31220 RepID=UPI0038B565DD